MQDAALIERIRQKFKSLGPVMDERVRRQWAAAEATAVGWGGIAAVVAATGMSHNTISRGVQELRERAKRARQRVASKRIRRVGGGRKSITESDPSILEALERLVEPLTRGDPESPLRWTCKSTRKLAEELQSQGHAVGERTVAMLLHRAGYSLQANRKVREGASHPDRNAQFEYINAEVMAFQRRGQPVISVDTKKKELVGDFRNGGREWRPQGEPDEVRVHDFQDPVLGKAIPYGVYDVTNNQGWVSVGIDHDTAEFAAEAIRRWWRKMGAQRFPECQEAADHRRRRRQQRLSLPSVESRPARLGRRDRFGIERLSFSARHQQVEQDRTSAVLPHHAELAGQAPGQSRGHCQPDRQHHHQDRPDESEPNLTHNATKRESK